MYVLAGNACHNNSQEKRKHYMHDFFKSRLLHFVHGFNESIRPTQTVVMTHFVIRSVSLALDKIPLLLRQPHAVLPVGHLLSISVSLKLDGNQNTANVTLRSPRTSHSTALQRFLLMPQSKSYHTVTASSLKGHNAYTMTKIICSGGIFGTCAVFQHM